MSSFEDLNISAPILKALQEMGFEAPTAVQSQAIPYLLNQKDVIVMSKTGSGKTAVFGVSMLQLIDPDQAGPQGLILTPTRELAVQVDSDIKQMGKYLPHKTTAVYGQHNINTETDELKHGVAIVTGTPGRVYDHIQHGSLITKHIRFLVLDEADRMLDMGFIDQVRRIIRTLPKNRVTLLFSATIPSEVQFLCRDNMKNPTMIEIESDTMTVDTTEQVYYRINENEKRTQLNRLLQFERPESCIIFCNMRSTVDRVQSFLTQKGYSSRALHGDIPQTKRLKTLQQFKQGDFRLLVATDVAARGIHIDELALVINYDIPLEKDGYVHRIGRTGRAGKVGRAVSLVTGDDIMSLYEIEEHIGTLIEEATLPTDAKLNENKELIDIWKKTVAPKTVPPRNAAKNTGQRQSPPRIAKQGQPQRPTQGSKSAANPRHESTTGRPARENVNRKQSAPERPADKPRAAATATQPVTGVSPGRQQNVPSPAPTPPVPDKKATATKKSWFSRIKEHIGIGRES